MIGDSFFPVRGNREESVKSRVNRIVALANHAQVDIGAQNAAQAIDQLEILDDSTEAVAADFGVKCFDDDLYVVTAEGRVELVVLETLQSHNGGDLTIGDELATQVEERAEICEW